MDRVVSFIDYPNCPKCDCEKTLVLQQTLAMTHLDRDRTENFYTTIVGGDIVHKMVCDKCNHTFDWRIQLPVALTVRRSIEG